MCRSGRTPVALLAIACVFATTGCSNAHFQQFRTSWDEHWSNFFSHVRNFDGFHFKHSSKSAALIKQIEHAHGAAAWKQKSAFSSDLYLELDGKPIIQGTLTFTTDGKKSRLDLAGGTTMVFDGERAWIFPARAEIAGAPPRFHLKLWPFLLSLPFRLHDPVVSVVDAGTMPLAGRDVPTLRLVYNADAATDVPDDWYLLYPDVETNRLRSVTFLSTYGKQPGETLEPSAIVYTDFVALDGVTLATHWTFYKWTMQDGITGDPVGRATLKSLQFVQPGDDFFTPPASSREDPPPPTARLAPTTQP